MNRPSMLLPLVTLWALIFIGCDPHLSAKQLKRVQARKYMNLRPDQLNPVIIPTKIPFYGMSPLRLTNSFSANFSICSLTADLKVVKRDLKKGFPAKNPLMVIDERTNYGCDDSAKFCWLRWGPRALVVLSTRTNESYDDIVPFEFHEVFVALAGTVSMLSKANQLLLIYVEKRDTLRFQVFGLKEGKALREIRTRYTVLNPFGDSVFLAATGRTDSQPVWYWTDTALSEKWENPFTQLLSEKWVRRTVRPLCPQISHDARIFFGSIFDSTTKDWPGEKFGYALIHWNQEGDSIRTKIGSCVYPSMEVRGRIGTPHQGEGVWYLSYDGKWLLGGLALTFYEYATLPHIELNVFFHVDRKYLGGISPPVYGATLPPSGNFAGCFVDHTELGMLYVDFDPTMPGLLFVYKMSDALKIIETKIQNKSPDTPRLSYEELWVCKDPKKRCFGR